MADGWRLILGAWRSVREAFAGNQLRCGNPGFGGGLGPPPVRFSPPPAAGADIGRFPSGSGRAAEVRGGERLSPPPTTCSLAHGAVRQRRVSVRKPPRNGKPRVRGRLDPPPGSFPPFPPPWLGGEEFVGKRPRSGKWGFGGGLGPPLRQFLPLSRRRGRGGWGVRAISTNCAARRGCRCRSASLPCHSGDGPHPCPLVAQAVDARGQPPPAISRQPPAISR